jgi:hypothetical protein
MADHFRAVSTLERHVHNHGIPESVAVADIDSLTDDGIITMIKNYDLYEFNENTQEFSSSAIDAQLPDGQI